MPYRHEMYEPRMSGTIAELISRGGQIQADALLRGADAQARAQEIKGRNTAHMLGTIGDLGSRTVEQIGQYYADAPKRQQAKLEQENEAWLRQRLSEPENPPTFQELAGKLGHERALAINNGLRQLNADVLADEKRTREELGRDIRAVQAMPEGMRQETWAGIRQRWEAAGAPPQLFPEQYDDDLAKAAMVWATGQDPAQAAGFTLSEGQTRFGPDGKPIANVAPKAEPPQKDTRTDVEQQIDDLIADFKEKHPQAPITPALRMKFRIQAKKELGQADDRPYRDPVPIIIQGPTGAQIVDRTKGTAKEVLGPDGKPLGMAPTAEMRNRVEGTKRLQPLLDSVAELTDKINVNQGVYAKMAGGAAKAAAKLNLDDDVAEYESMVQAFTPIWARALGHTGVLTQQDVDSARAALPAPGNSRSLRDRKIARIHKILGTQATEDEEGPIEEWVRDASGKLVRKGGK